MQGLYVLYNTTSLIVANTLRYNIAMILQRKLAEDGHFYDAMNHKNV